MRTDGAAAVELMLRLAATRWGNLPLPWRAEGIELCVLDGAVWAWRIGDEFYPSVRGCWTEYVWDTEAEYIPGAEIIEMVAKRNSKAVAAVEGVHVADNDPERKKYPLLMSHLCDAKDDDGDPRELSTISTWRAEGCFKGMLRDRQNNEVLFVAAPTLEKVFLVMEKALASPSPDWRPDNHAKGKKGGKK